MSLRQDLGPQYSPAHFEAAISGLGICDSPAFLGERPAGDAPEDSPEP